MSIFKCKMCGGALEINQGDTVVTCDYCGTQQTLPKLDDEKRVQMYDRANHFRRNNEYDKAMGIYEQILNEDSSDAEAYWSLVLCRYGIEYVEDPASHKRIPTVNRAQFTSVFDDDNYKSALEYSDTYQKTIYEKEAKAINEIQKGILAISQKEEPFDVFICYKETDNSGRRTPDSVLAQDLYYQLKQEGFKVFFSRITLEDKLGSAYEPYIFAALNSSKVMVVLGTKPDHFNAVWVKNEWSRYLALIKQGQKKMLIPAYKDMDPYDLPEEFSHLQAQDMSRLGFMQDLIRGIKKIVNVDEPAPAVIKETVVTGTNDIAPLLERAFMFLEDGEWESAEEYCEKVLDIEPKCAKAYLGKLMAELGVRKEDELCNCKEPFDDYDNYSKTVRFADEPLRKKLESDIEHINNNRLKDTYAKATQQMNTAKTEDAFKTAAATFDSISEFKDAKELSRKCLEKAEIARKDAIFENVEALLDDKRYLKKNTLAYVEIIKKLEKIREYKDADEKISDCRKKLEEINAKEEAKKHLTKRVSLIIGTVICFIIVLEIVYSTILIPNGKYNDAMELMDAGKYVEAISLFSEISGTKDADEQLKKAVYKQVMSLIEAGKYTSASDLLSRFPGNKDAEEQYERAMQKSIELYSKRISALRIRTIGLKADGTVVATDPFFFPADVVSDWKDIVALAGDSDSILGIKADGTVVAEGLATSEVYRYQVDVSGLNNAVAISCNANCVIGLMADGTVVAAQYTQNDYYTSEDYNGNLDFSDWKDIVAISAGSTHTVGIRADGTVVAVGDNDWGQCDVSDWTDIVAIDTEGLGTVGLKSDGTVVATGYKWVGDLGVSDWNNIVAISKGLNHCVGLKSDGTVVAVGDNDYGQCNVSGWRDIVAISAGDFHTVGVKADGTVVAVGDNRNGKCDVSDWDLSK